MTKENEEKVTEDKSEPKKPKSKPPEPEWAEGAKTLDAGTPEPEVPVEKPPLDLGALVIGQWHGNPIYRCACGYESMDPGRMEEHLGFFKHDNSRKEE